MTDPDAFAVEMIRRPWCRGIGPTTHADVDRLLVCADGGASHGYLLRASKAQPAAFAAQTLTRHHQVVIDLIGSATTCTGSRYAPNSTTPSNQLRVAAQYGGSMTAEYSTEDLKSLPRAEFAFPGPLRDKLVAAVLNGTKTSTTGLVADYEACHEEIPRVGERSVVIDSEGRNMAVLEVTRIEIRPLDQVDLQHALDEGEGHESVLDWRADHEAYWHSPEMRDAIKDPGFTVDDQTQVVLERFRVVRVLPAGAWAGAWKDGRMTEATNPVEAANPVEATTPSAPSVVWSKAEQDRAGTPLLVMLHGYGADEADLFSLAEMLPDEFTVASLRGPETAGPGYSWFPLRSDVSYAVETVKTTTTAVTAWLDGVRAQHSSVTLLGFSQGMCMATSLARHRPHDYAAVVGLSGFVVDAGTAGRGFFHDAELAAAELPVFWGRDQADPVIPAEAVDFTATWLRAHSKLTKVLYTGIWHGINAQEMAHVKEFLSMTVLKTPTADNG